MAIPSSSKPRPCVDGLCVSEENAPQQMEVSCVCVCIVAGQWVAQ